MTELINNKYLTAINGSNVTLQGGWGRVDVTFGSSGGKTTMKVNNIGDSWVLQNLGFAVDHISQPNYWYVINGNHREHISPTNFFPPKPVE